MNSEEKSSQLFDNLLFPKILQTFRMAIQPSKLTIAFSALAVICLAGWLMDICTKTVITTQNKQGQITNSELQVYMSNPDNVRSYIKSFKQDSTGITVKREGVFSTLWNFAAKKFQGAVDSLFAFDIPGVVANIADYFRATGWAFRYHPTYCIIFGIIKLAVIALVGGAICRLAALQLARSEKPGLTEAMRFGTKKFTSLFTAGSGHHNHRGRNTNFPLGTIRQHPLHRRVDNRYLYATDFARRSRDSSHFNRNGCRIQSYVSRRRLRWLRLL